MGIDHSIRGYGIQSYAGGGMFVDIGDFSYDSSFDRSLLRYLERQGRRNEFWEAAFHSDARFQVLWNEVFSQYVYAVDLQTARGMYVAARLNENLAQQFKELSGGVSLALAGELLLRNWDIIMDGEDYERTLIQFQWLIRLFNELAAEQGIEPQPNVLDSVVRSHIYRYRS